MIPKKLFCPKCLLPDRNEAFKDDLTKFYEYIQTNITKGKEILSYHEYKIFYKLRKMSMLHFSKKKEESAKEYYEVLFGEVQSFFFKEGIFNQIFSIYTLYSLYYTQTTDTFYQINTILEFLLGINNLIQTLINSKVDKAIETAATIFTMIKKLKDDEAFSIGVIPGLKSIILNKYGIPIENKENIYNYTKEINFHINELENKNIKDKVTSDDEIQKNNQMKFDYNLLKKNIVNDIKNLNLDKDDYIDFINSNFNDIDLYIVKKNNYLLKNSSDYNGKIKLKKEDIENKGITQLDFLFNKLI